MHRPNSGAARAAVPLLVSTVLAGAAVAACTSSGGSAGQSGASAAAAAAKLDWHPCPTSGAGAPEGKHMKCASLQVPLDYSNPGGRKITLALSEIPATAPVGARKGVLLVNPGGPGASGTAFAANVASGLSPGVAAQYDIVGFDTRGVGASIPSLHCEPSFFSGPRPNYVPANQAAEQVLLNRARQYAAACEKNFGWLLPHMTTQDLARDMDSIRLALGQRKINYYGVSYGTYLGQVYATMFPHHLRRMVLDSIVNPDGVWYADNIQQDYAFQGRMDAFETWLARHHHVYGLGSTPAQVQATYAATLAKLASHPINSPGGPIIGPDELTDTILTGGYDNAYWPYLAAALSSYLHHGSATELTTLYQQIGKQGENEFAVYLAVQCSDVGWPRNWARWDADTRRVYRTAPFLAWDNAWFNAACAFWPVRGPAMPLKIGAAGLPPILLLQGTLDAATPYHGALVVRRLLPTSRLVVTVRSGNHGQSLSYPPNNCVNNYVDRYLASGRLPTGTGLVNATCPATPAPKA